MGQKSYQPNIFTHIFDQEPLNISPYLLDAQNHINMVHAQNDAFISLGKKLDANWHQHACKYKDLINKINQILANPEDTFMSVNAFKDTSRKLTSLNLIQGLYTDLDYYKLHKYKDYTPEQMYSLLKEQVFKVGILPYPSFILSSGRGLQLVWLLQKVPATQKSAALYQKIQDYIQDIFAEFGADPASKDATHVFRIAGTENSKNNKKVGIHVVSDIPYTLRYFQNEVLPPLEKTNPQTKKYGKAKVKRLFNTYSLSWTRLQDLERLQQLRQGSCEGLREVMCFLYRYWSCCYTSSPQQALIEVHMYNQGFEPALEEREVITATKSAEKAFKEWLEDNAKGYNYSNKKLVNLLNITTEEQMSLQTIISTEEKYRRNNNRRTESRRDEAGMTARERAKQEKVQKVWELHNKGLKQRKIAEQLGISQQSVSWCLKQSKYQ